MQWLHKLRPLCARKSKRGILFSLQKEHTLAHFFCILHIVLLIIVPHDEHEFNVYHSNTIVDCVPPVIMIVNNTQMP